MLVATSNVDMTSCTNAAGEVLHVCYLYPMYHVIVYLPLRSLLLSLVTASMVLVFFHVLCRSLCMIWSRMSKKHLPVRWYESGCLSSSEVCIERLHQYWSEVVFEIEHSKSVGRCINILWYTSGCWADYPALAAANLEADLYFVNAAVSSRKVIKASYSDMITSGVKCCVCVGAGDRHSGHRFTNRMLLFGHLVNVAVVPPLWDPSAEQLPIMKLLESGAVSHILV